MPENWQKYHFPDPTFCTPYLPFLGLVKALNERITAEVPPEAGGPMDEPEKFTDMNLLYSDNAHYTLRLFDENLASTAGYYVNTAKYDNLDANSRTDDLLWTWEELTQAAGGGEWLDTFSDYKLTPDFPAKWAKQRYNAVNLLRYGIIDYKFEWIAGNSSYNATKLEAYQHAFANATRNLSDFIGNSFLGYDTGGDAIFAMVEQCRKFYPDPPAGINLSDFWAVGYAAPWTWEQEPQYEIFDPLGANVVLGWNRIKAQNGYFIKADQNYAYPSGWDSVSGRDYEIGWMFNDKNTGNLDVLCYADFNPIFNFKEEP